MQDHHPPVTGQDDHTVPASHRSRGRNTGKAGADTLRIIAIQANPTVGDIPGNVDLVRQARATHHGKADLLVFSECIVTGYPLGDLVLRPSFMRDVRRAIDTLSQEIEGDGGPAVLVGAPHEGGAHPYNAAYLLDTDGSIKVSLKHRLPNDEVYDEKRTFAEGPPPRALPFRGFQLGVLICEDLWNGDTVREVVESGAEILIVINGSHFRVGKQETRIQLGHSMSRRFGIPLVYVNQFGGQDELVFDGGSFAMTRTGALLAEIPFREGSFRLGATRDSRGIDMELDNQDLASFGHSYPGPLASTYLAMVTGLRDYVDKCRFPGVVLGMSGGVDSALSAAIAVDALGAERVLLVRMPSGYTSSESMEDAELASGMLGTAMETISISPAVEAFRAMLTPVFEAHHRTCDDTTEENIQARARGMTLMALSNKLGLMVLTTGNKSEMSVGYSTLYGDMCGGYSVLKDCYKTTAFELCTWRNGHHLDWFLGPRGPVMPERIISKPPSAELAPGQTDESTLGSYRHLDAVLRHMVEGLNGPMRAAELASQELGEEIDPGYARRIAGLVARAQYKRDQSPPGVVISGRDYRKGWRLPIVNHYGI